MNIAYIRVSEHEQNKHLQYDASHQAGCSDQPMYLLDEITDSTFTRDGLYKAEKTPRLPVIIILLLPPPSAETLAPISLCSVPATPLSLSHQPSWTARDNSASISTGTPQGSPATPIARRA